MSEQRMYRVKKRRREVTKQKWMLAAILAAVIIVCSLFFNDIFSSAHGNTKDEPVNFKYYKSIQVETGDTLWSIANEYITDDCKSVSDYVQELVELNALDSKHVTDGEYLLVAYNDTTFK